MRTADGIPLPEGWEIVRGEIVEAYYNPATGEVCVIGSPGTDDESHSCDEWGCPSIGHHTLVRSRSPDATRADALDAAVLRLQTSTVRSDMIDGVNWCVDQIRALKGER